MTATAIVNVCMTVKLCLKSAGRTAWEEEVVGLECVRESTSQLLPLMAIAALHRQVLGGIDVSVVDA